MIKQQTNETLRADMWRACDILRRDNNVGGVMQYTEHIAWLLFLKFLDEEEKKRQAEALLEGKNYQGALLGGELAWDNWAGEERLKQWEANDLIQFVRGRLLPGLSTLSGPPLARTIARIFSDESVGDQNVVRSVPVCASGFNLKEVLQIINTIRFESESDIYTISQVYEDLLERMGAENRIAGEFYTPRSVIEFMVEVIAPQVGEEVYDPACGSAGFLVGAYQFTSKLSTAQSAEAYQILQHETYYGKEKKALSYLLGMMNLVLHGVATPNIERVNTLEEAMLGSVDHRRDIILTNPPFGGTEGRHIQQNFPVKSNATELLFLEHILKKLKRTPNARAAVVVPEGTLFRGGAFADVKKDLLEQFHLFAVVSLPPGTFAPYSDVKTALLFFQRPDCVLERNPLARHETWYYELPLPEGLKKFSKGSKIQNEHFASARQAWQAWQGWLQGSGSRPFPLAGDVRQAWEHHYADKAEKPTGDYGAWVETIDDLKGRGYDLSARNPNQDDRVQLPHPAEITARLLERTRELHSILENLHEMVSNGSPDTTSETVE
ncbi:MAG: class I SAM-dependent DNA methyltransferase [Caldilineaceae bacterium]